MNDLKERARAIRLLVLDVDGVLTDGRLYIAPHGDELKCFHVRDGYGLKAVRRIGIEVAVITGRRSEAVARRMRELGIEIVRQGVDDKLAALLDIEQLIGLDASAIACVGDDTPDVAVMRHAALAIAVADAHQDALDAADHVTGAKGGRGAVREVCDLLLAAHGAGR